MFFEDQQIDAFFRSQGFTFRIIEDLWVCPTRLTARNGQIWWIMYAPAKIGDGLVNLERVLSSFL